MLHEKKDQEMLAQLSFLIFIIIGLAVGVLYLLTRS